MSKYISEDVLLEDLWESKCESDILRRVRQAIVDEIIGIEGIDIVLCKECRYCKKKRGTFKGEPIIFYRCTENNRDVEADDFCSWGEREGE